MKRSVPKEVRSLPLGAATLGALTSTGLLTVTAEKMSRVAQADGTEAVADVYWECHEHQCLWRNARCDRRQKNIPLLGALSSYSLQKASRSSVSPSPRLFWSPLQPCLQQPSSEGSSPSLSRADKQSAGRSLARGAEAFSCAKDGSDSDSRNDVSHQGQRRTNA